MIAVPKLKLATMRSFVHLLLRNYYPYVAFIASLCLFLIDYLSYQLEHHNRDLYYYLSAAEFCMSDLEYFGVLSMLVLLLLNFILMGFVLAMKPPERVDQILLLSW